MVFVPLLLILLNKHNLDSQREDRVCRHDHGHVTWHIGHTPDSFTGGSLQSTSIFHYLHRQHTPWFRKQLRTFTCKSIKIIAPILFVCIELNPGPPPPKCYLCRKSIKTNDHKLIHCGHCSNWIHRNCCNIDDSEYRQLVHSTCSWACPECNHFNISNSFFDDTEILTSNQFDPLDNVNRIKTKNLQSSKNGRNNKGHKPTKRSNLRCILINCQSIRKKCRHRSTKQST